MNRSSGWRTAAVLPVVVLTATLLVNDFARAEWTIDLSRRQKQVRESDLNDSVFDEAGRAPASVGAVETGGVSESTGPVRVQDETQIAVEPEKKKGLIEQVLDPNEPIQDVVILNTEKGFLPSTVRVKRNSRYMIHVVNVNEKEKNVSFILDAFSEHHATFYGKTKSFLLEPKKEGVYSFQSPETSAEGRLIVFSPPQITVREPANDEGEAAPKKSKRILK